MLERFQAWWQSISQREQQLSLLSAVFLLVAMVYWGGWQPLNKQLDESEMQLQRTQQTLRWVEDKSSELVQAGMGESSKPLRKASLSNVLNVSAKQYGIEFSRIVNKKDEVEVWIDDVAFDRFIAWLTELNNRYGVVVMKSDVTSLDDSGKVKINRLLVSY
ncbi:type II secretion system protein M [Psychromonas sp. MME2]|uniref:type II secretion system protein M n=1 Tax=unclassified Psychromonas TaxID=2614957 RepID=UPI00339C587E